MVTVLFFYYEIQSMTQSGLLHSVRLDPVCLLEFGTHTVGLLYVDQGVSGYLHHKPLLYCTVTDLSSHDDVIALSSQQCVVRGHIE